MKATVLTDDSGEVGVIIRVSLCRPGELVSGFYIATNPAGEQFVEWDSGMLAIDLSDVVGNGNVLAITEALRVFVGNTAIIQKVGGIAHGAEETSYSFKVDFDASNDIVLDIDGASMIGEEFALWFKVDWDSGSPSYSVRSGEHGAWVDLGAEDAAGLFMVDGQTFLTWLGGRAPSLESFFDFILGRE